MSVSQIEIQLIAVVVAAACAAPTVHATLLYRAYPWWLRRERGWAAREIVMAEVVR